MNTNYAIIVEVLHTEVRPIITILKSLGIISGPICCALKNTSVYFENIGEHAFNISYGNFSITLLKALIISSMQIRNIIEQQK